MKMTSEQIDPSWTPVFLTVLPFRSYLSKTVSIVLYCSYIICPVPLQFFSQISLSFFPPGAFEVPAFFLALETPELFFTHNDTFIHELNWTILHFCNTP